jgi:small subunit ribosomal protein S9
VAEPVAEEPAAEPVAEEPVAEPVAEEPAAEPVAEEPVADVIDEPADGVEAEEATSEEEPEDVVVEDDTEIAEADVEEIELTPRQKPEIPGADLIPDIIPEGEEFLDAEAQAAAEAEAEAAAAREQEDQAEAQPIADAAIDLAAGARYTATGKRKTAVARVILKPGTGSYSINGKQLETAFPRDTLRRVIRQPLETVGYESRMDVIARMHGGGVAAQAGALRHGISRALLEADPNLRGELKRRGFLTRDPRVKERKKAGLKKARKRPQFSKR